MQEILSSEYAFYIKSKVLFPVLLKMVLLAVHCREIIVYTVKILF